MFEVLTTDRILKNEGQLTLLPPDREGGHLTELLAAEAAAANS